MSSGSSTAGSNAFSSDMDESNFLKRNRMLHWVQLGLSSFILIAAIAVIPCAVVPYQHYLDTAKWATASLAIWPQNLDLRPTVAALSCGCVITFLNLIYVVTALLPSPHSRIRLVSLSSAVSAFGGFLTALICLLFIIYRPSSTYPTGFTENETLHSWTCKWEHSSGNITAPAHFERDCRTSHASFALVSLLLGLEICMGIAAVVGTWFQKNVGRRREEQAELEKLEIATKQAYQAK
ncbi:hypothetical protein N7493_011368 [Penicillium malachiteum]|uniref:Uncharacterized protein n=1 Tax=Penicillium malachiteum TaxID=1324776 RepID=A0AAD6HC00_9EURO|nr:hypothetical protein N7493_011368 [Penicillium malachiteum]